MYRGRHENARLPRVIATLGLREAGGAIAGFQAARCVSAEPKFIQIVAISSHILGLRARTENVVRACVAATPPWMKRAEGVGERALRSQRANCKQFPQHGFVFHRPLYGLAAQSDASRRQRGAHRCPGRNRRDICAQQEVFPIEALALARTTVLPSATRCQDRDGTRALLLVRPSPGEVRPASSSPLSCQRVCIELPSDSQAGVGGFRDTA